jgi:hypothetical protein
LEAYPETQAPVKQEKVVAISDDEEEIWKPALEHKRPSNKKAITVPNNEDGEREVRKPAQKCKRPSRKKKVGSMLFLATPNVSVPHVVGTKQSSIKTMFKKENVALRD